MKIAYYAHHLQYLPYQLPIWEKLNGIVITTEHKVFKFLLKHYPELDHLQYIDQTMLEESLLRQEVDTLVISDHYPGYFEKLRAYGCRLVHTLHGVSLKPHLARWSFDDYDLTLLPSEFIHERIALSGQTHFFHRLEKVGLPKLDALLNKAWDPSLLRQEWGFDERPIILYAPTWNSPLENREDSSLDLIGRNLIASWPERWNLLVKLHPNTYRLRPEFVNQLRELCERKTHVKIVDPDSRAMVDNVPLYLMSDALLGDVSSVNMDYYAVGKPMLLVKPKDAISLFDPFWESVLRVEDEKDVIPKLEKILEKDPLLPRRKTQASHFLGALDGKSADRAAQAIKKISK